MKQQQELYGCCQMGNLERIRYLVAETDVDLNRPNADGYTPLQIAFFSKHLLVMQFLLESGAKETEFSTLELPTDREEFRNYILRLHRDSLVHPAKSDAFSELLKRILMKFPEYTDVEFIIKKERLRAHKLILAIQCPYFKEFFNKKWKNQSTIDLTFMNISMKAFKSFISYFYGVQQRIQIYDLGEVIRICKFFNMTSLLTEIKPAVLTDKKGFVHYYFTPKRLSQEVVQKLFLSVVPRQFEPKRKIKTTCVPDVHFIVGRFRFMCHKVLVCERSNYFKALCADYFCEFYYCPKYGVQVVTLSEVDPVLFVKVLQYLYTDACDLSSAKHALDLLCLADMFMLPGLKRLCSLTVMDNLTTDNVISAYKCATLFSMELLQFECSKYMLLNFTELKDLPHYKRFIEEYPQENWADCYLNFISQYW